jgi:hypothetical protein
VEENKMDKYTDRNYNNKYNKEKGVIYMLETITPTELRPDKKEDITKKLTAMDIRRKNGVRTSTGKRLVDIFKEGK